MIEKKNAEAEIQVRDDGDGFSYTSRIGDE